MPSPNGTEFLDPGPSSGLGEDKAGLLSQWDGAEPSGSEWDTGHLETVLHVCCRFSESYHHTHPPMHGSPKCSSHGSWKNPTGNSSKLKKIKGKEKFLEDAKGRRGNTYRGAKTRITFDFSEIRPQEKNEVKYLVLREKNHQTRILQHYPSKAKKKYFLSQTKIEEICCQWTCLIRNAKKGKWYRWEALS